MSFGIPFETLLSLLNTSTTVAGLLAGVYFMMKYLSRREPTIAIKELAESRAVIHKEIEKLKQEIESDLSAKPSVGSSITEAERAQLLQMLTDSLTKQASESVLSEIKKAIAKTEKENEVLNLIQRQSSQTIDRLTQELFSLSKRGNLNLSIGITTTLTGLVLLGMFVLRDEPMPPDTSAFIINFVPRISLVILIEVFAYFFLRLYKTTLSEIKYFQNEITSIESKFLALTVAAKTENDEHINSVISHLATAERNFILDKGQTTVDLERSRLDQQERTTVWGQLGELLKKKS